MEPARKLEVMSAYHARTSAFDEIARRRARRFGTFGPGPRDVGSKPLSPRELQVLTLVAEGCTSKEVGKELFLAEETVKSHITNILTRLEARNRAHAVALAIRRGLLIESR
jgi:DNA-binding NarL/FixJ family response regulator